MCKVYNFNEVCPNEIGDKVKFPFTGRVPQLGKTFMYSYDGIVYKCINISSEYVIGEIVDFVEIDLNN